jgi:hypothetical protein
MCDVLIHPSSRSWDKLGIPKILMQGPIVRAQRPCPANTCQCNYVTIVRLTEPPAHKLFFLGL